MGYKVAHNFIRVMTQRTAAFRNCREKSKDEKTFTLFLLSFGELPCK